jgi:hypothetical protein
MSFKSICGVWGATFIAIAYVLAASAHSDDPNDKLTKLIPGEEVSEKYINYVLFDRDGRAKCKSAIEDAAQYDLRWPGGWLTSVLTRWNATAREDGYIRFSGDNAEAQNLVGLWVRVTYHCLFDPDSRTVIGVSLERTKIPRQ